MREKLKPCPACGGDAIPCETYAACGNRMECCVTGPNDDPDGAKWNALPRREDAPLATIEDTAGMSDGELIARAQLVQLAPWQISSESDSDAVMRANRVAWEASRRELFAELDRRAAARKESK